METCTIQTWLDQRILKEDLLLRNLEAENFCKSFCLRRSNLFRCYRVFLAIYFSIWFIGTWTAQHRVVPYFFINLQLILSDYKGIEWFIFTFFQFSYSFLNTPSVRTFFIGQHGRNYSSSSISFLQLFYPSEIQIIAEGKWIKWITIGCYKDSDFIIG